MCNCTSKLILTVLSVVFWAAAGFLLFIGISVYVNYGDFHEIGKQTYTLLPATILIAIAVFFVILGIIGCVGAYKEQKCLLGMFFTVLVIILLSMIAAAIIGFVARKQIKEVVLKTMKQGWLKDYGNVTTWTEQIDYIQENLKCCGIHNYTDWQDSNWYNHTSKEEFPKSCCLKGKKCNPKHPVNGTFAAEGCYDKIKDEFKHWLAVIGGVALGFTAITFLGVISSCVLICKRRDEIPYIGLGNDGLRV